MASLTLAFFGAVIAICFAAFALVSLSEGETRAAALACLVGIAGALPLFLALLLPDPGREAVSILLAILVLLALVGWFLPLGSNVQPHGSPGRRVDERDIMFARARLVPGSPEFESYYAMRPANREGDDRTRALPGLLSLDATKADPVAFASAKASELVTASLRGAVDGPVAATRLELPPAEMTATIKRIARYHGARDVGVTECRPYHVYTHIGRGSGTYGAPIVLDHRWAVAVTVEMAYEPLRCAPEAPVVAESCRQYVESSKIAVQLAALIRSFGYPARAHIDGNYRVIAPLVARDAGLGEIGRMGLLMTRQLGPRVRLAVVTTDVPLHADPPGDDVSVIDFCTACKKCAENCPSQSIPSGDREPTGGARRWAIDPDSCFRYWSAIGTDCGRCLTVCPYSHPDSLAHNLLRWAIRRSGSARRAALWMDDLFYGRSPRPWPSTGAAGTTANDRES